jgi:hypothetical protein
MTKKHYKPSELLGGPRTADYLPSYLPSHFSIHRTRPPFSSFIIREMLTDPRIIFGLWLIKGPILTSAKFEIEAPSADIQNFIQKNLKRFWKNSASRALKAVEWGYSASEVLYRLEDGRVHFDILRDLEPLDCRAITKQGEFQGMTVDNVPQFSDQEATTVGGGGARGKIFLGGPKAFWHVHGREKHPWYGMSRLYGCHIPWWEQWSDGGYRDIRRLWFYKNSFEGGIIYHPPGTVRTKEGTVVSNRDLARELLEKKRAGGTLALPNTMQDTKRSWEYEPPSANAVPTGLLEYGDLLRREVLEGMGIPNEVIDAGGNQGFGSSSGRKVPQLAFFSTLQELVQWLVSDIDKQILRPLVTMNFGDDLNYEINVLPLTDELDENKPQDQNPNQPQQEYDEEGNPIPPEEGGGGGPPGMNQTSQPPGGKGSPEMMFPNDRQQAFGLESRRSRALKRKAPLRMAVVAGKSGSWTTIGGQSGEGEDGEKVEHKGGMHVFVSKDGKVLAGGPRALHGKHISQAGEVLDRLRSPKGRPSDSGTKGSPKGAPRRGGARPHAKPKGEMQDDGKASGKAQDGASGFPWENDPDPSAPSLPSEADPITDILQTIAGKDPTDQEGFLEYMKEAHKELQSEAEFGARAKKAMDKLAQSAGGTESSKTVMKKKPIKDKDTGKVTGYERVPTKVSYTRYDPTYAPTFEKAVSKLAKEVKGLDVGTFKDLAREHWNTRYADQYEQYKMEMDIRKRFHDAYGLSPIGLRRMENAGKDFTGKHKGGGKSGKEILPGFDRFSRSMASEYQSFRWTNRDDEKAVEQDMWEMMIKDQPERPMQITDKAFMQEVLGEYLSGMDAPTEPVHLTHDRVIQRAIDKWDKDSEFNPGSENF